MSVQIKPYDKSMIKQHGMTLDEIRYQRAYMMAKIEIVKQEITDEGSRMRNKVPATGTRLVGGLLSGMSYLDYAVLAFRLGSKIFSLTRRFRKKK